MSILPLLILTLFTTPQTAPAPSRLETGSEWLARCRSGEASSTAASDQMYAACLAWIEGLIDINEIYRGLGALEKSPEGFCMPVSATVADAARAVVAYFHAHRAELRFSARILAYMALRRAFPCGIQ